MEILNFDRVDLWPPELLTVLQREQEVFLNWRQGSGPRYTAGDYDRAYYTLAAALQPFALLGWHCTRLTDEEIRAILTNGMQLPNAEMLRERIDRLLAVGELSPAVATRLKARHQAADGNRAGKVWFCFYPPRGAGESGIARFFRHWGGEALYNSHEEDQSTSPELRNIGTPALIEAEVPLALLGGHSSVPDQVALAFLISGGYCDAVAVKSEWYIVQPLPPERVRRVIRFPEAEFLELTGCAGWRAPIRSDGRALKC